MPLPPRAAVVVSTTLTVARVADEIVLAVGRASVARRCPVEGVPANVSPPTVAVAGA